MWHVHLRMYLWTHTDLSHTQIDGWTNINPNTSKFIASVAPIFVIYCDKVKVYALTSNTISKHNFNGTECIAYIYGACVCVFVHLFNFIVKVYVLFAVIHLFSVEKMKTSSGSRKRRSTQI